ncbi:MAG: cyclic nucleotide-binding domain-containing protein [Verrucomicrobiota bacterium]
MASPVSDLLNNGLLSDDSGVSTETRELLASESFAEILSFSQDTFIIYQGKEPDALYFTLSGLFHAISHAHPEAPQRLLGRIEPGEFIGEVCLVDRESTASASVKALKNAQILKMTRDSFDDFCKSHPVCALELTHAVATQLGRRLRKANERVL